MESYAARILSFSWGIVCGLTPDITWVLTRFHNLEQKQFDSVKVLVSGKKPNAKSSADFACSERLAGTTNG
jgi:hypothetical protein